MRVVLQRVRRASVTVDGELVASIDRGYLLLVGIGSRDADTEVERMAEKVANLRLFADRDGKTNLALSDVEGQILVVSQFTLYADVRKGSIPGGARPHGSPGRVRRPHGRRALERRAVHPGPRRFEPLIGPGVG